ncbi:MAG: gliding motility protein GldB [Prevotella sp.]|nr:gliding motility protein GldB [Prevotella sp.]
MKQVYYILFLSMILCVACEFKLKPGEDESQAPLLEVVRYDRLEYRYLTTGDFSALQEMNTEYPIETRTLIEDVLKLGTATDPEINTKLLKFYQDTTLQMLIADTEAEFANMDDLNKELNMAFMKLKKWFPDMEIPQVYAQISALDESIVVGNQTIGISLDKYLGADYPYYKKLYPEVQRRQMTRDMILPEALSFYLISIYSLPDFETRSQEERDLHMGKIQWIVNQALDRHVYSTRFVHSVDTYMKKNPKVSYEELLKMTDFSEFDI